MEIGALDPDNEKHLICLQNVMVPRLNVDLDLIRQAWDRHPLSSEGNRSPQQLWVSGQLLKTDGPADQFTLRCHPAIQVVNPNAPGGRQQTILLATNKAYREIKMTFPLPPVQLLDESYALAHAEMLLHADGIPAPLRQQCLGKLVVRFGQYLHAPFHWLLENDVGYLKKAKLSNPLAKGKVHNQWKKDRLPEYAESFSQVSIDLEANVHQCVYGQKGFENHTSQEMCQYSTQKARPDDFSSGQRDLIQKADSCVCWWLHTPVTHITSVQMKRFMKFIYNKKKEQVNCLKHTQQNGINLGHQ
ncbi:uncharacterized protein LOC127415331 [Myxocyprinus asiaticus]|uniref:uncharacterized protein LOC127415331 n=1 Tax=Myxocyprinus asiaticus TaxID=70543 RepID=UPI00222250B2|nr:uncharacterized protein LOC127415331 [Myxocyprinus asiaticus]XP_051510016.1 uncharacterized protein LOC127415331 [Myxocyprinus asiaticus]XP_051510017.1 uncharacterized protein LOC127415331 [Myxocyprinus asiaticus]XP_051510018.1 uncharacterized protein LOC127415331 [Myxocyprinus asiaticus]XP_051510020.1 uncharacterized protein LOC127415331 [Myxocyprinus asiaticus]XP_051510021.1 uncharacterized protein LOC127415331 [Myxocyprinus asiaticus]XP_051510022.1 uncharacterized protein LOC127415331 [